MVNKPIEFFSSKISVNMNTPSVNFDVCMCMCVGYWEGMGGVSACLKIKWKWWSNVAQGHPF